MNLNVHIFKVTCAFNNEEKEFLVAATDHEHAQEQVYEHWSNQYFPKPAAKGGPVKNYCALSISRLGAVVDCTGQQIAKLL